jgi:hypothetical protein
MEKVQKPSNPVKTYVSCEVRNELLYIIYKI